MPKNKKTKLEDQAPKASESTEDYSWEQDQADGIKAILDDASISYDDLPFKPHWSIPRCMVYMYAEIIKLKKAKTCKK
jgi:hypothetical protein